MFSKMYEKILWHILFNEYRQSSFCLLFLAGSSIEIILHSNQKHNESIFFFEIFLFDISWIYPKQYMILASRNDERRQLE
jgi:hypothetical protein